MAEYEHSAELQKNYEVKTDDYLASEMLPFVVLNLEPVVGLAWAMKIFILIGMVFSTAGVIAIHFRCYGSVGYLTFLVPFLLYSKPLSMGFLGYEFGNGLALLLFAGWMGVLKRGYSAQTAYLMLTSFALFSTHLLSLALYLMLCGLKATAKNPVLSKKNLKIAAVFLPPSVLVGFMYYQLPALPNIEKDSFLWGWVYRLLFTFDYNFSTVMCAVFVSVVLFMVFVAWRERLFRCEDASALRMFAALGALILFIPVHIAGISYMDARFQGALALLCCAFLGISPSLSVKQLRILGVLSITMLSTLLVRHYYIAQGAANCDAYVSEIRAALNTLPKGTSLAYSGKKDVLDVPACNIDAYDWHWAKLAVIDRDVFVPGQFFGQFELYPSAARRDMDLAIGLTRLAELSSYANLPEEESRGRRNILESWPYLFDYLIDIDFSGSKEPLNVDGVRAVAVQEGRFFTLYRLEKY